MKKNFIKKFSLVSFILTALVSTISFESYAADSYATFHTSKKYLVHINRGYIAMSMYNYPLALKEFATAKYLDDSLSPAYEGLGNVYEITRNYAEALNSYQTAINLINPRYAQSQVARISYYKQNRMTKSALAMYKSVLSIRPEAGLQMLYGDKYNNEGSRQQAYINYKRAYQMQENPEGYLKYIQIKYPNKEFEKYVVEKYLKRSLRYPEAHYKAGLMTMAMGNYTLAVNEFNNAVDQMTVTDAENKYIYNLGLAYYKLGTSGGIAGKALDNSIANLQRYLKINSRDINALFTLSDSYFYKDIGKMNAYNQELEDAVKEFNKVSGLPSDDPEQVDKKEILNEVLNKKYNSTYFDKSINTLSNIKSLNKSNADAYYKTGNAYFKKANMYHKGFYNHYKSMNADKASARDKAFYFYQKASDEYRKYISLKPYNDGTVFHDIGVIYYECSKLENNASNLPITPDNRKEYERWGAKFYKRDMLNRSIANFNVYLSRQPRSSDSGKVYSLVREMQLAKLNAW